MDEPEDQLKYYPEGSTEYLIVKGIEDYYRKSIIETSEDIYNATGIHVNIQYHTVISAEEIEVAAEAIRQSNNIEKLVYLGENHYTQ